MLEFFQSPFIDTMCSIAMIVFLSSIVARWGWMIAGWIVAMFDYGK
jgi:hypothetical protein